MNCKGHCIHSEHCNKLTGGCDNGCATQWTGNFCDRKYTRLFTYNIERKKQSLSLFYDIQSRCFASTVHFIHQKPCAKPFKSYLHNVL